VRKLAPDTQTPADDIAGGLCKNVIAFTP
jgi:hypothetical protein